MSLGPKCHFKPKVTSLKKHAELETLYGSILKLQTENIITVIPNLKPLLKAESTKNRNFNRSALLTDEKYKTAKDLKEHPDIIVCRTEKPNMLVILDRSEYKNKLQLILNGNSKFKKISRNPIKRI